MSKKRDHQPIEDAYAKKMRVLAETLDKYFNPDLPVKTVGFALLIFELGDASDKSRVNYIANANREDMLVAMKEFIARAEGRYVADTPGAKQ